MSDPNDKSKYPHRLATEFATVNEIEQYLDYISSSQDDDMEDE